MSWEKVKAKMIAINLLKHLAATSVCCVTVAHLYMLKSLKMLRVSTQQGLLRMNQVAVNLLSGLLVTTGECARWG